MSLEFFLLSNGRTRKTKHWQTMLLSNLTSKKWICLKHTQYKRCIEFILIKFKHVFLLKLILLSSYILKFQISYLKYILKITRWKITCRTEHFHLSSIFEYINDSLHITQDDGNFKILLENKIVPYSDDLFLVIVLVYCR